MATDEYERQANDRNPSKAETSAEVKGAAVGGLGGGMIRCLESNRWFWIVVATIVLTAGTLEVSSALGETQTWDEGIHISAGYAYLTDGDYRWNQEHPPLAKLMSALPLTGRGLALRDRGLRGTAADEIQLGIDFLYQNRVSADSILFSARAMTILLSMLFLAGVAWWVRSRFGVAAALLAVCLCAFDPNLIAHSRYVTTDFPVTVFYFFSGAFWADYLLSGRFRHLALAATAFALAMVTKFSALLLVPILTLLYVIRWIQAPREFPVRRAAVTAAVFAGITFVTVNLVYWPETLRCLRTDVPLLRTVVERGNVMGEVLFYGARWLRLPAHAFFTGLSKVAAHNQGGHSSYLLGMRSEKGWWYYFPVVYAVKSTMAGLAATVLLLGTCVWGGVQAIRGRYKMEFVWFGLLVPPAMYFLFSMTSAINIGMRHILPVYPFLYVAVAALLARGGAAGEERPSAAWQAKPLGSPGGGRLRRAAAYTMIALGLLQIGECARITPDYLAFFNALSGGPGNGPQYLVDSNIDWGQDMKKLAKWLKAHGTNTAYIAYFGNAQMPAYGLAGKAFPESLDERGWDAMDGFAVASVTPLEGVYVPLNLLARLRLRQPVAKIGWSMYVYDFRKRLGP